MPTSNAAAIGEAAPAADADVITVAASRRRYVVEKFLDAAVRLLAEVVGLLHRLSGLRHVTHARHRLTEAGLLRRAGALQLRRFEALHLVGTLRRDAQSSGRTAATAADARVHCPLAREDRVDVVG